MPTITGGGASNITGAQMVDGTIANVDIANTAAIDLTKLAGLVGNPGAFISIESEAATTHSLVTDGNTRVLVIARATMTGVAAGADITLSYNAVVKDTQHVDTGGSSDSGLAVLMYSEVPAAGTHNITLDNAGDNPLIVVIKLRVA